QLSTHAPQPSTPPTPSSFARFALTADAVKATPKKLEKIEILRSYLAELTPDDAASAATSLTGRAFPQRDERNLQLGWALIKRAVLEIARASEADFRAAYHRYADAGDAAGTLLATHLSRLPSLNPRLSDIASFFDRIAAARGPAPKLDLL